MHVFDVPFLRLQWRQPLQFLKHFWAECLCVCGLSCTPSRLRDLPVDSQCLRFESMCNTIFVGLHGGCGSTCPCVTNFWHTLCDHYLFVSTRINCAFRVELYWFGGFFVVELQQLLTLGLLAWLLSRLCTCCLTCDETLDIQHPLADCCDVIILMSEIWGLCRLAFCFFVKAVTPPPA